MTQVAVVGGTGTLGKFVVKELESRGHSPRVLSRSATPESGVSIDLATGAGLVGIDAAPLGYYRLKLEQEQRVEQGPMPYTVLRTTQFHQLLDQAFSAFARFGFLPGGATPVQPIDPREVAVQLVDAVEAGPGDPRLELAGPEIAPLGRWAREWRTARLRAGRIMMPLPLALLGAGGRAIRGGALTSREAPRAAITFERWLAAGDRTHAGEAAAYR